MSDKKNLPALKKENFIQDILLQVRLIIRLIGDKRVSAWLKILPIASVAYWLLPDLAIGPVDDVAVIWVGLTLFVEMCPRDVVEEHRQDLWQIAEKDKKNPPPTQVIEGEFKETPDEGKESIGK